MKSWAQETYCFVKKNPLEYHNILRNDINCIEFKNSLQNFVKKLNYILKNQDKLMQIAKQAYMEAHAKHTWDNRSYQLIELINQ